MFLKPLEITVSVDFSKLRVCLWRRYPFDWLRCIWLALYNVTTVLLLAMNRSSVRIVFPSIWLQMENWEATESSAILIALCIFFRSDGCDFEFAAQLKYVKRIKWMKSNLYYGRVSGLVVHRRKSYSGKGWSGLPTVCGIVGKICLGR